MSTDGRDWTLVPGLPLCVNPVGLQVARMSAGFTQESLVGPCPLRGSILIYGQSCRCGVADVIGCGYLVHQAEPALASIPLAPNL